MAVNQWVRLQTIAPCGLRLGAWYPVAGLSARAVEVRIRGQVATLPRAILEFRLTPPQQWTVVRTPMSAPRGRAGIGDKYLVCPNCRHRGALPETQVRALRCERCNQEFAIGWDENYLRSA